MRLYREGDFRLATPDARLYSENWFVFFDMVLHEIGECTLEMHASHFDSFSFHLFGSKYKVTEAPIQYGCAVHLYGTRDCTS